MKMTSVSALIFVSLLLCSAQAGNLVDTLKAQQRPLLGSHAVVGQAPVPTVLPLLKIDLADRFTNAKTYEDIEAVYFNKLNLYEKCIYYKSNQISAITEKGFYALVNDAVKAGQLDPAAVKHLNGLWVKGITCQKFRNSGCAYLAKWHFDGVSPIKDNNPFPADPVGVANQLYCAAFQK